MVVEPGLPGPGRAALRAALRASWPGVILKFATDLVVMSDPIEKKIREAEEEYRKAKEEYREAEEEYRKAKEEYRRVDELLRERPQTDRSEQVESNPQVESNAGIKIVFTDLDGTIVHYPGERCIEVEPVAPAARTTRGRNASAKSTKRKAPGKSAPVDPSILRTSLTVEEWTERADTEGATDINQVDTGVFSPRPRFHMKAKNHHVARMNAFTALVTFSTSFGGCTDTARNQTPMVMLPPSSSGATGYISAATLGLFDQVRARGAKVVVISGCRYSTLMQRLQYLPSADAYVCESGGRIFYRDDKGVALWEDLAWRRRMDESGQIDAVYQCLKACRLRFGKTHEVKVDDDSYSTAFRVRSTKSSSIDIKSAVLKVIRDQKLEDALSVSVNLGCVDVYPKLSGKRNAAAYVAEMFGGWELGKHAAFFCDDDNDVELAMEANRVFMPLMSENLAAAVMDAAGSKDRVHERFRFLHDKDFRTHWNHPFHTTTLLLIYLLKEMDAELDQRQARVLENGVADRDRLDEGGLGYCLCCGRTRCKEPDFGVNLCM